MSLGAPPARWTGLQRVLAVRLDNLGDVLMCTPALAAMREAWPRAHLALLASRSGAALAPHLPLLDEVLRFDAPWVAQPGGGDAADLGAAELALVERLRQGRFDAAVIFTVCSQSALPAALLCRLAGIPLRLAHSRENPYGLLSDWVRDADRPVAGVRHEVQRQLDLLAAVGVAAPADARLRFTLQPADRASLRALLQAAGVDLRRPHLLLHPGSTAASRRYPAEAFGQAAKVLAAHTGCQVLVVGGPGDAEQVAQVMAVLQAGPAQPATALLDQLSLGQLAQLIASAEITLCNNSAPAHLAAALGAPAVVLYAQTNPQHTPWRAPARVLSREVACRDCLRSVCPEGHHACLRGIAPAEVVQAALQMMSLPAPPAPALRDLALTDLTGDLHAT